MTDPDFGGTLDQGEGVAVQPTAGSLLRAARERQGMHIAVLATTIKVSPRKLDALENDRFDELPDATFVRALALTVCRALKIDSQPVMSRLPASVSRMSTLEDVQVGLRAPFPHRGGRPETATSVGQRRLVWAGVLLLVAALALLMAPSSFWDWGRVPGAAAPAESTSLPVTAQTAASAAVPSVPAASMPAATVETVHSAPVGGAELASPPQGAALSVSEPSWVEATDGAGQALLSRIVQPGESINLEGALPLRLTVGNVRATRLSFRGQPVDLAAASRDNVARVELK